jgi:hypothetical protein
MLVNDMFYGSAGFFSKKGGLSEKSTLLSVTGNCVISIQATKLVSI